MLVSGDNKSHINEKILFLLQKKYSATLQKKKKILMEKIKQTKLKRCLLSIKSKKGKFSHNFMITFIGLENSGTYSVFDDGAYQPTD